MQRKKRLGDLLVEEGLINKKNLNLALAQQKRSNKRLGSILLDQGAISSEQLLKFLSKKLNIKTINLSKIKLNPEVVNIVPENFARKNLLIPIDAKNQRLVVAISDPTDYDVLDQLIFSSGYKTVIPVLSTDKEIKQAIDKYYSKETKSSKLLKLSDIAKLQPISHWESTIKEEETTEKEKYFTGDDKTITKLTNHLFDEAIRNDVRYIHIEPENSDYVIKFRHSNGNVFQFNQITKNIAEGLINKLRVISSTKFTGTEEPQLSHFSLQSTDLTIALEMSIIPLQKGRRVVLSIYKKEQEKSLLEELSISSAVLNAYRKMIQKENGIIIVSGTPGSGKTETLEATLREMVSMGKIIFSIESQVREDISGVNQIAFEPTQSLESLVQNIFKQNPDVLMFDFFPNTELMTNLTNLSQGRVLLLLEMNGLNAISTLKHLNRIDVSTYSLSLTLNGILCQRQLPKLCNDCKRISQIPEKMRKRFMNVLKQKDLTFYDRVGCNTCKLTGYDGFIRVYELLEIDTKIANMFVENAPPGEIRDYAISKGMKPLQLDALKKAAMGFINYEKVIKMR